MNRRAALAELQKATIDTSVGGLLTPEQSKAFIEEATDSSVFGSKIQTIRKRAPEGEISKLGVGSRLLRGKPENADDGYRAGATTDDVAYSAKKVWLPFEITNDWSHENIEGESAKAKVIKAMQKQLGLDLDDLDINGDTASSDAFVKIDDGLLKLAAALPSGQRVDTDSINSGAFGKEVFKAMIDAMPDKYLAQPGLSWLASPTVAFAWTEYLSERDTAAGDGALMGKGFGPYGIPWFNGQGDGARPGIPFFPDNRIILADPQNFARVVTWDVRKFTVTPETDWELATRDKEGHVYFIKRDFIILEDEAVVDAYDLTI